MSTSEELGKLEKAFDEACDRRISKASKSLASRPNIKTYSEINLGVMQQYFVQKNRLLTTKIADMEIDTKNLVLKLQSQKQSGLFHNAQPETLKAKNK